MTIHQLKGRCWLLDPSPYADDDYGIPHYATRAEADEALTELHAERKGDPESLALLEGVQPKREDDPCWVADCDAFECEERYEDDEYGGTHFGSASELEEWMKPDGWTYRGGDVDEFWPASGAWDRLHADQVYCSAHSPEGVPLPPSPAELESAGQLRLPGVT